MMPSSALAMVLASLHRHHCSAEHPYLSVYLSIACIMIFSVVCSAFDCGVLQLVSVYFLVFVPKQITIHSILMKIDMECLIKV